MDRLTFAATSELDGNTLSGIAYRFGQRTLIEGRWVQFAKSAFDAVLASDTTDVRAFYQHDPAYLLGRQSNGTVDVTVQGDGLHYSITLPDTSYANDIRTLVARGDLNQMSFGIVPGQVRRSVAEDGKRLELHLSVKDLFDISPVSMPAFDGTTMQLHSLDTGDGPVLASQLVMARHRARYSTEGVAR